MLAAPAAARGGGAAISGAGRRLLQLQLQPACGYRCCGCSSGGAGQAEAGRQRGQRARPLALGSEAASAAGAAGAGARRGFVSGSAAARAGARLYTMGEGYYGALGQGDFDARERLTPVPGLAEVPGGIRDAACGWAHAAVATGEGRLLLFGRPHDVRKALSLRHMWQTLPWLVRANQAMKRLLDSPAPGAQYYKEDVLLSPREFPLPEGERAARVACSGALTAVTTESGRVFCMGANAFGQCGLGAGGPAGEAASTTSEGAASLAAAAASATNVWTPMAPVTGLDYEADPVAEACLGFQHALVRTHSGKAYAWGKGERGQLGNGATANHPSAFPVDLPEGTGPVVKVAAGFNHGAALTADGAVWVWGKMQALAVKEEAKGGGRPAVHDDQLFPRQVPLPPGAEAVDLACGHFHTTVLLSDQAAGPPRLLMFGMRAGVRSMEPAPTPVPLPLGVGVKEGGEWVLGGAMAHTVLYARGSGQAFKAEFDGSGTVFAPVLAAGEEPEEEEEGSSRKRGVLKYAEGLAHRLVLLEE